MKKSIFALLILLSGFISTGAMAQSDPDPVPPPEGTIYKEKKSGWFLGSDQGALVFLGNSGNLVSTQYYGTFYGGYNFKGIVQPMLRLGQAIGHLEAFFQPTTFFFIVDAGAKFTPLRTKVRPYFVGTAGFYVLDFSNFGGFVQNEANFTFSAGGGIEVQFGRNVILVGSEYRGFRNSGPNLQAVSATLGYTFQF